MRLYLDDNSAKASLIQALRKAGHDVQTPSDLGLEAQRIPAISPPVPDQRMFSSHVIMMISSICTIW